VPLNKGKRNGSQSDVVVLEGQPQARPRPTQGRAQTRSYEGRRAFHRRLLDGLGKTHEEAAALVGLSRSQASNIIVGRFGVSRVARSARPLG
jgi:hypothetical protein